jgi:hypothetical protein
MKTIVLTIILAIGALTMFTACERNDYQHPMHRK